MLTNHGRRCRRTRTHKRSQHRPTVMSTVVSEESSGEIPMSDSHRRTSTQIAASEPFDAKNTCQEGRRLVFGRAQMILTGAQALGLVIATN